MRRRCSAILVVTAPFFCGLASGAAPPAADRAALLFSAAKSAMANGDYAAACPELVESESLDPQIGTLLNLAYCYENMGRMASAWFTWLDAATAAGEKGQNDRQEFARYRARQIEPRLLRVTITVAPQLEGKRVAMTIDNAPLARDQWGVTLPLDPGEHVLWAGGAGLQPWLSRFAVDETHVPSLFVPALAPLPPQEPPESHAPKLRPIAWVAGGVGVAGLAVGVGFGVSALGHWNDSNRGRNCVSNVCNAQGTSDRTAARREAPIADVSYSLGAGALVTAAVLALWPVPRMSPTRVAQSARVIVRPRADQEMWGVRLDGSW